MKSNNKTLLAAIVLATAATTLSMIAAVPLSAFADESETETDVEAKPHCTQSGFNNVCNPVADADLIAGSPSDE